MLIFDTSSIIYAWDNYPIKMFPSMWRWLEKEIQANLIVFSYKTKGEIELRSPECARWVKSCDPKYIEPSPAMTTKANQIKELLGIVENKYGEGVDEIDLIIIATAFVQKIDLVSNEAKQPTLPQNKSKYKIPAVCSLHQVQVRCISFLDYLHTENPVF